MNDLMLCKELADIKQLLTAQLRSKSSGGNTITFYPLSPETMELAANSQVQFQAHMGRPLQNLAVNAPDGIEIRLFNENELVLWMSDDHGAVDLPEGLYIGNMTLIAINKTGYPLRWSVKMVWGTM
jgi:hypothetical protein